MDEVAKSFLKEDVADVLLGMKKFALAEKYYNEIIVLDANAAQAHRGLLKCELHATTDYVAPFKIDNPRGTIVYGEKSIDDNTWEFNLPKGGMWYLYLRGSHPGAVFCDQDEYLTDVTPFLNDVKLSDVSLPVEKWSSWVPLDTGLEGMKGYKLQPGGQKVKLTGFDKDLVIEGLLFASNPMDVEDSKRE